MKDAADDREAQKTSIKANWLILGKQLRHFHFCPTSPLILNLEAKDCPPSNPPAPQPIPELEKQTTLPKNCLPGKHDFHSNTQKDNLRVAR